MAAITNLRQLLQSALNELGCQLLTQHTPWQILLECSILTRQAFLGYSILCKSPAGALQRSVSTQEDLCLDCGCCKF